MVSRRNVAADQADVDSHGVAGHGTQSYADRGWRFG